MGEIKKAASELPNGGTGEEYSTAQAQAQNTPAIQESPNEPRLFQAKAAAEFGEDETRFVWYPYIPVGDYSVLMAPGGTGKTYLICGIAAAVSRGRALPGDDAPVEGPQNTLIISAEDRGELLKKRLKASGADLDRVFILDCMASVGFNFSDGYQSFKRTVMEYKPRLVIADPWHAFVGDSADLNRVNAIRPVFQKLANLAKECECGLILISHVNKRAQGENVNHAATGSTDFINAARSALYVIFDDQSEDERVVIHSKSNYARHGQSVKFRINQSGGLSWAGFSDITRETMEQAARQHKTPGEVIRGREERTAVNNALVDALMDAANPFDTVRYTYDAFKKTYGMGIFGTMQPKRALDGVADAMSSRGYELTTGVQVKLNGVKGNGFALASSMSGGT